MFAVVILMRFWQPKDVQTNPGAAAPRELQTRASKPATGSAYRAWLPWILLTGFVFTWGLPFVKDRLNALYAPKIPVPLLHRAVEKMPPVAPKPELENALYTLNLLSATGTALLLAGIASAILLGVGVRRALKIYGQTLLRVRISLLTISVMMALGFTTRYSGTDTTMGLAMAGTGWLFPFFSPLIGWLGVALTGSDTSSNVLFGNLQKVTAEQLDFSPILMCASNSSGGVMGKMIDAQSIVVASVATGGHPESPTAGTILRSVFWHSVALAILVGVLVMLQAYVWTSVVPAMK
jgi:lactate permease